MLTEAIEQVVLLPRPPAPGTARAGGWRSLRVRWVKPWSLEVFGPSWRGLNVGAGQRQPREPKGQDLGRVAAPAQDVT